MSPPKTYVSEAKKEGVGVGALRFDTHSNDKTPGTRFLVHSRLPGVRTTENQGSGGGSKRLTRHLVNLAKDSYILNKPLIPGMVLIATTAQAGAYAT